jgi:hypothetical protein
MFESWPNRKKIIEKIKKKTMKNITRLFAFAFVILAFSATSYGQATATAVSSATIITPISIAKDAGGDLNFGNVAVSATTGGTVVLPTSGVRTKTGGVTLPVVTGTVNAASFTVTGSGTSTYSISLPTSDVTLTGTPSGTMIVNTFVSTPSGTGALTGGTQVVKVGATLNVTAAQPAGTYTNAAGLFVTVNYN